MPTLTSAATILTLGYSDPRTDVFGAHPLLGPALSLNDGTVFTLVSPDGLELSAPEKTLVPSGNIRTQGERAVRALYRRNRTAVARLILGPVPAGGAGGSNYASFAASIRALVRWLDAPPATPITLKWQPPSATSAVYLDVVGAAHGIPADEREWLRLQLEPIEVVFLVRPGLRGDRVTLSNLLSNPGFEAGSGPGAQVFSDTFATLDAYAVQAGGALARDTGPTYADTVLADGPARYYRLDEASGAVAIDAGSTGVNATVHGSPTLGVVGLLVGDADTCYTLAAASSQYLSAAGTALPTGNAALTLEAVIQFAANPSASAAILAYGNPTITAQQVIQLYLNTAGNLKVDFATSSGSITSAAALTTGVAHHVAVTYDGATLRLYVDGGSVGSSTPTALAIPASPASTLGALTSGVVDFWNGQLDECAVYTTALSAARIAAHHSAMTSAPSAAAHTALLASGDRVAFGSPSWGPINGWQMRFRWFAGATATWYLHYTDANNYLAVMFESTSLNLVQTIGGVAHTLATTAAVDLVNGVHYWLQVTQFPCAPGTPAAVQAQIFADGVGASQGSLGASLSGLLGPAATWDVATALSGAPQIAVSGASLGLGGAYASVHTVALFGPGGWNFTGLNGAATGASSGAWEQATANTFTGGAVTSFGAARVDLPPVGAPAGSVDAAWESYSGSAVSGAPGGSSSAIPATTGQAVAASVQARSTGLSATATLAVGLREWDASGALLRQTALQTLSGNHSIWTPLGVSGSVTAGASTAVSLLAEVADPVAGASAGATVWFDNAQVWNQTTTGQAVMPYCELRFPQSPAQLLVTGLLGDLPAPAHVAWGTYLASWPTGSTLAWALGRRARASANARLVGSTLGYYGAALTPTATPILEASAYGGWYPSVTLAAGWNPRAFSFAPADALGVYHLFTRFWSAQSAGNLTNFTVRAVTAQRAQAWYGALDGSDLLGEYDGPYLSAPLAASSVWQAVDGGQVAIPMLSVGALTDLTAGYLTPRPQWYDATGGGGAAARCDWQALVPVDGSLLVGVVNNPANGLYAVTARWLWSYVDGLLVNRAAVGDGPATLYSLESGPTPNPAAGAGGPGTQTTGALNTNSGADPYLTLDPTVGCASTTTAAGGQGVNQFAGYVSDNAGDVMGLHAELQYSPLYLYPR